MEENNLKISLALYIRFEFSIFQNKYVTSSIPDYFQNSQPPIICYTCKYNKPIRNIILSFNKLVSDLDIDANTPDS